MYPIQPARAFLLALGAVISQAPASAAPPLGPAFPAPSQSPSQSQSPLRVRSFQVIGEDPLPAGESMQVLAPFLRRPSTPALADQAAATYERALHERGFKHLRVVAAGASPQDAPTEVRLNVLQEAGHEKSASIEEAIPRGVPPRRGHLTFGVDDSASGVLRHYGPAGDEVVGRRIGPLQLGYAMALGSDESVSRYLLELAVNTGGSLGSGDAGEFAGRPKEASRFGPARLRPLSGLARPERSLSSSWVLGLRAHWQYPAGPAAEGFGLGRLGRGRSADDEPSVQRRPGLRLRAFLDAGWLENNALAGQSRRPSDIIASAGLGLRYAVGPYAVSADYGRLLKANRVGLELSPAYPRRGDERLLLRFSVNF